MDEEIERLVVGVRADTAGFARDVDAMRASLDGPLTAGVDRAGRAIESALGKALRTGSFGFEDLRKVALSVLGDIASAALRSGLNSLLGGSGAGGGGGSSAGLLSSLQLVRRCAGAGDGRTGVTDATLSGRRARAGTVCTNSERQHRCGRRGSPP